MVKNGMIVAFYIDAEIYFGFIRRIVVKMGKIVVQSNLLKWTALEPGYEHSLRQSICLSMFYILRCV